MGKAFGRGGLRSADTSTLSRSRSRLNMLASPGRCLPRVQSIGWWTPRRLRPDVGRVPTDRPPVELLSRRYYPPGLLERLRRWKQVRPPQDKPDSLDGGLDAVELVRLPRANCHLGPRRRTHQRPDIFVAVRS